MGHSAELGAPTRGSGDSTLSRAAMTYEGMGKWHDACLMTSTEVTLELAD